MRGSSILPLTLIVTVISLRVQIIESGRSAGLKHLLDSGGDPNVADELGRTPLHIAAKTGDIAAATLLLERDANIDAIEKVRG